MIYLDLFLGFLQVGLFSFGGAYGAIPLIREVVLRNGWLEDETLSYMIAVSESTPGPIMINLATYIGSSQGGLLGSALATAAVVLPSFVIILLITAILQNFIKNPWVQAVMSGMKPCIVGIILVTGAEMILSNCFGSGTADLRVTLTTGILAAAFFGCKYFSKKKISPIGLILMAALLGMIVYGI